jgi:hypothetical protein
MGARAERMGGDGARAGGPEEREADMKQLRGQDISDSG